MPGYSLSLYSRDMTRSLSQTLFDQSCHECDYPFHRFDMVLTVHGDRVCEPCARRDYWRCECDQWVPDTEYNCPDCGDDAEPEEGRCDCGSCDYDDDDDDDLINSYSYAPYLEFHGEGPVFLGLEVEVSTRHGDRGDLARTAVDHLGGMGCLKEDGSIGDGFEIVTQPMTWEYARESFPWRMFNALESDGADAAASCGIHVHVSRDGFDSPAHIYKWLQLIYRNQDQVQTLARRESDQWAAFTEDHKADAKHHAKGSKDAERYRAVNVTNDDTFEVRVFASSLDACQIQAALAFVAAGVEYTRHLSVPQIVTGGWDWAAFYAWIAQHDTYAALTAELEDLECVS